MESNTLLSIVLVSGLIIFWVKRRYDRLSILKRNGIPGPQPHFLYGNFHQYRFSNVVTFGKWLKDYGPIFGYYTGPRPSVVVSDIELLKLIQIKDFHLFVKRRGLIKGGIEADVDKQVSLVAPELSNERWKQQRSMLTTTFSTAKMKSSVPLVNDAIDSLLQNIQESQSKEIDIYAMFQGLTMDTIGRSAFGIKTDVQRNPDDPFFIAAQTIFKDNLSRLRNALLMLEIFLPEFSPVIYPLRYIQWRILHLFGIGTVETQQKFCREVIKERRQNISDPRNPWSRNDLLQLMLEANMTHEQMMSMKSENLTASLDEGQSQETQNSNDGGTKGAKVSSGKKVHYMTDHEVASNAVLFFDAGYETTSTLLGFVAHVLVNYPEIQEKIREEVRHLYESEGKFDYNAVHGLPYLDAVINETLRMYPPITTFITRVAAVDYKYKNITIPKGSGVLVPVYQLHHDPNLWDDPETFNPDRFLGVNKGKSTSIAFQPFGAGPRNCIGMRFALMEAKIAVARILFSYRLEPGPQTELGHIKVDFKPISMTPKKGVFIRALPLN